MPIEVAGSLGPIPNAGAPVAGTNEVQTLTYAGVDAVATAGTFRIAFEGYRTVPIAFNAAAATVTAALEALPSIGTGGVVCTLGAGPPRVYTLTFSGGNMAKQALPAVTIEDNTMTAAGATAVTITVAESVAGVSATARGAAKGAILVDTTNAILYINTGTALAPTWTKVGLQT